MKPSEKHDAAERPESQEPPKSSIWRLQMEDNEDVCRKVVLEKKEKEIG